jgi:hypothetical protein
MLLIRTHEQETSKDTDDAVPNRSVLPVERAEPPVACMVSPLEHTVRSWHAEGRSQRAIARDLNIDRRRVKRFIEAR